MKRRHLVVLVSGITLLTIIFVAAVTIGVGVGTDTGREQIRQVIEQQVGGRLRGRIHIGTIRGGLLTGFTLDTFAIRDLNDSLLVSTGRITMDYDPRDLIDRRLLLRNVVVEHPVIRVRQYPNGDWNFQRIFNTGKSTPNVPGRSFGDYVVMDSVRVRDGQFLLIRPWDPDDTLKGAKRDSAIRVNLADTRREIRRTSDGFTHTYRWSSMTAFLPHVRLADPDSDKFGKRFEVESIRLEEQEPPFSFRSARGVVRKLGDSVFVDMTHFELPASNGSARAKIWWGSDLPIRFDIRITGDNVALNDVAFVYPTLPRIGGGRADVHIYNNKQDLHVFEYAISNMDVRSERSRLLGAMTFVVGRPVLEVRNVDLRAAPVNFDLLRTLAGAPFPVDWQGDLTGFAQGRGGPLTHFIVDRSDLTWQDAHVRGAVSRVQGRGELDIERPAFTVFHGFDVSVDSLDLRSIQYLFAGFPHLGGTVAGTATLDSSWLDVRFSKANVTHRNGPGDPTRVTGAGRVTYGADFMKFDVAVNAEPVSLTMLSRSYPLGLQGLMTGPIQAKGTTQDLSLTMDLTGDAGHLSYSGRVDAYPLSIAARGSGRIEALNPSKLVAEHRLTPAWFTGTYQLDIRGDTNDLGTLRGTAALQLERGEIDSVRVFPSRLHARFADGKVLVDTARVETTAATVTAQGALGLTDRVSDSLTYTAVVDSLGGLRRYVTRFASAWTQPAPGALAPLDSLAGSAFIHGAAVGSVRRAALTGNVTASKVFIRREAGREIHATFEIADLLGARVGRGSFRFDTLNVGGMLLDTLGGTIQFSAEQTGSFSVGSLARNGSTLSMHGDLTSTDSTMNVLVRGLDIVTDSGHWELQKPASVLTQGKAVSIDSLRLTNRHGGLISLVAEVPDTGRARILFKADSIPLHDVANVLQLRTKVSGWGQLAIQGAGLSASPVLHAQARLSGVTYGGINLERVTANADYSGQRALVALDLARSGRTAVLARASLPVELKYFGARLVDDSLKGTIRTDSASFDIVELISGFREATGRLDANLDIAGTWKHPDLAGSIRVNDGEVTVDALGVRLRGVNVDVAVFGHRDSLAVRRLSAWTTEPADSISLGGYIAYSDLDDPYLQLTLSARTFRALDRRSLARLDVSTEPGGVKLRGRLHGATLTGGVLVDRGTIYLPDSDLQRKRVVDLGFDTTTVTRQSTPVAGSRLLESILIDNVRVRLGDDVWLRSREANIKLGGTLNVRRSVGRRSTALALANLEPTGRDTLALALEGELRAERGSYTLPMSLVTREFVVEGGTITFFPTPELPSLINISALYTVHTEVGSDLRIRLRVTGDLSNPTLNLESAESFQLSQSDLVSYLIFGQQTFELGDQSKSYVQLAAQTIFPSLQTVAASQLRTVLGSWADVLQLRLGFDPAVVGSKDKNKSYTEIFWTSRLGAEKQLSDKLYVSLSTGICQLQQQNNGNNSQLLDFYNGLSGKIEYRLSRDAALTAGKEPSALSCRTTTGRVVPTPSQWGFSLFKSWRF